MKTETLPDQAVTEAPVRPAINPWLFVPLLYIMQAIPVTIVQEVATVFYKDLGIANAPILQWTSLISLPWSLQLLLGPLVDLNGTKRRWILGGEGLITIGLIASALLLKAPHAFEITLVILAATAVTSALCNIATDGFYIISMSKAQQAKFVGVQTTCYRLGRLFCTGILVLVAGLLMNVPRVPVQVKTGDYLEFKGEKTSYYVQSAEIGINNSSGGPLTNPQGDTLQPEIAAPPGTMRLAISPQGVISGMIEGQVTQLGQITYAGLAPGQEVKDKAGNVIAIARGGARFPLLETKAVGGAILTTELAWILVLAACGLIYGFGFLGSRKAVPYPAEDHPAVASEANETGKNVGRTVVLLLLGVSGYFFLNSVVRLGAYFIWKAADGTTPVAGAAARGLQGWILPDDNPIAGFSTHLGGVGSEIAQLVACGVFLVAGYVFAKRLLARTAMADALMSFTRQSGFPAILGFILFYRLGEAMVGRTSPLFLKDAVVNGGLAISDQQLGLIKGVAGVLGIVCGGLLGGAIVSKYGLRRAFWPIAILMHLPNLLYLWASYSHPPVGWMYGVDFTEQFGYGFGFAGYMVYLMYVAQRGSYKTSHYAIGSGLGAMCVGPIAGAISAKLLDNFGYHGFFTSVIFLTIPGMLMLLFIPFDEARAPSHA